ncbi:MAG: alpha/beta hydrolase-fold protein [Ignavibacteriales bacterium]|nr:alpha/beta hydrolase-fold protein [Ignavibacteriales bacterium]
MLYKNIFLIVFILWANASFSQAQIVIGQKEVLHSKILNEDRVYQIYLPESYKWASDRSYPVLYLLDGDYNFLHSVGSVSFLSGQGEIPELIVVAITSTVRIRDFTQTDWSSHWIGGGGANNFKRFLSEELIPKIDKDFRTKSFRILSGHSASGQFALYCLSSQPSLFNAYFAISPSLDWDNELPQRSLAESFKTRDSLKAFLYFAYSDDLEGALDQDLRIVETLKTESPKGLRWICKGFPDETHGSVTLLAQIDALRQLFTGYRFHNDLLSKGLEFAEKHFQEVSKRLRYDIPVPEDIINNFGYEAIDNGKIQEAILLFKRNIEQNPNSANAYDSITDAYEKAGMWREAIESSEKAVELAKRYDDPNLSNFILHAKKIKDRSKLKAETK